MERQGNQPTASGDQAARRQLVHDIRNSLGTIMLDVHSLKKSHDANVVNAVDSIEHEIGELRNQLESLFKSL